MLQQTQVATVIPYYLRFLARFPNLESLAAASEDQVLALWSGLGYYARGRNLLKAARVICAEHDGQFPNKLETANGLPGIGRSTAAAILALTWNQRETILDGNVKRVLTRYHTVSGWPGNSAIEKQLWQLAEAHTPANRCADYTQAIMDLGATVCRRTRPHCSDCPVQSNCGAYRNDSVSEYPAPKPKKVRPHRRTHMLLLTRTDNSILLEKRPPSGIWGGLWCLPELPDLPRSLDNWVRRRYGLEISHIQALDLVKHSFTHFDLTISPLVYAATGEAHQVMDNPNQLWYNPRNETNLGISAAVKKIIDTYLLE